MPFATLMKFRTEKFGNSQIVHIILKIVASEKRFCLEIRFVVFSYEPEHALVKLLRKIITENDYLREQ